jgi:glycoside/pentoside/hexuronide:cation symporter, GPH family
MNGFRRVLYAAGQLGMMALTRYLFGWIIDFSSTEGPGGRVLLSATMVGAVFLGFRVFDGLSDPIAGMLSDGWVRRGRERRRLLWASFLLPSIGLALCFAPSHEMPVFARWVLLCGGLLVFFSGYTFYAIPYWSLVDDYSGGDEGTRRSLSTALGAGLMVATAVGFVASPRLVESVGFFGGAIVFAVPAGVAMILPYFAAPPACHARAERFEGRTPVLRSFGIALRHRRFLALLVLFSGSQMSFTIMTAAAPFIAIRLLGGSRSDVSVLLGPLLGVAVVCFPLVPWVSRRLGWERGLLLSSIALAAVYAFSALLGEGIVVSPVFTAMVVFGLAGPMTAVLLGLESEAITTCARERGGDVVSTYFGVFNLVVKSLNGVALLLAGTLADLSRGEMGTLAVRLMSVVAGFCIFACVGLHLAIRPKPEER